ncbi:MAG TPA: phosphoribosylglycinamide synthetase C domain-containing protein, partial [Ignavibacteria bacterium]|nr:phosphoribosylglycinamide synthetase C domain-containing protein [Ignavibacteria bacterium]
ESGNIDKYKLETDNGYTCCIVLASGGYPDSFETGKKITRLDKIGNDCLVFHAGTKEQNGEVVSSGGRVLNVVGYSNTGLREEIDIAYSNAEKI